MSRFGEATAVERVGEGRYKAELDGAFGVAEALNGGYLMAVLARAAVDASPHAHPMATSANFLRVARRGVAEVLVETLKAGRTAATARVSLVQDGSPLVEAQITTGTLDAAAEPAYGGAAPAIPPVEDCTELTTGPEGSEFADHVLLHFDPATLGWLHGRPSGRPELNGWFALREDYPPDAFALALAVDALPPVVVNAGFIGWAPTVQMTWYMRAVPAPGPLRLHGTGRLINDGWFDEEVEVWDSAGHLVAQSRQLARLGRT